MKAESSQAGRRAFLANVVYLFIALPCLFTKFSVSVFTAAVWCVPALRVPLVHSQ